MQRRDDHRNKSRYPPSCRVFIGNIDPSVHTDDIQRVFEAFGAVLEPIRMHKGYAFVQYDNTESAESAIRERHGMMLGGKPIDVQLAKGGAAAAANHDNFKRNEVLGKRRQDDDYDHRRSSSPPHYNNQPNPKRFREDPPPTRAPGGPDYNPAIPVYIINSSMNNYAHYILSVMTQDGLNGQIISLNKTSETYFTSEIFLSRIRQERYVIVLQRKNEDNRNVAFRGILPDGSSPGFADTPIGDVVQFILNAQPPVVAPPMIAPPQQQIHQPPPMYAQGPPHEQPDPYNDSQLNSLLINLMDQLKQPPQPVHQQQPPPDYARHPSDPYYNAPPPSSPSHGDDMSSLLSTIQHLGSMGKGRQQY